MKFLLSKLYRLLNLEKVSFLDQLDIFMYFIFLIEKIINMTTI
ncbi:hypothetical protein CM15mP35_04840 [bacterium]|nr:MAG: hypothetical protein CM15mP35_04840 [bacterium]